MRPVMLDLDYIAETGVRSAIERYEAPFLAALWKVFPTFDRPLVALDLCAGEGVAAIEFLRRAPSGSRLVALADESRSLERLHHHAARALDASRRASLFPRREDYARLAFAGDVFDLVYASLPFGDPEPRGAFAQAMRVLKPGGFLAFAAPLPPSLLELSRAIAEADAAAGTDPGRSYTKHFASRMQLPTLPEWLALVRRAGGTEVVAHEGTFVLAVGPDAAWDVLFATRLTPLYLAADAELARRAPGLLARAAQTPFATTVALTTVRAIKSTTAQRALPAAPAARGHDRAAGG